MRGIAALAVVPHHALLRAAFVAHRAVLLPDDIDVRGVDFSFVISGFHLAGSVLGRMRGLECLVLDE